MHFGGGGGIEFGGKDDIGWCRVKLEEEGIVDFSLVEGWCGTLWTKFL